MNAQGGTRIDIVLKMAVDTENDLFIATINSRVGL